MKLELLMEFGHKLTVRAVRVTKHFAVHRDLTYCDDGWNVTHIPSGCAVAGPIPKKEKAIAIAKDIEAAVDWSKGGKLTRTFRPAGLARNAKARVEAVLVKHGSAAA